MKIPDELIPKYPHCGKPLTANFGADDTFVQDEGWYRASERYPDFLRRHRNLHILYLELGIGYNTPVIIKYPFWQMTAQNPKVTYACINLTPATCPNEIEHQSVCINADIYKVVLDIIQR